MTNGTINIKKLIETIRRTNIYTPIIEAVVNAIDAINEARIEDGEISVSLIRSQQEAIDFGKSEDNQIPPVVSVKVTDNGIGFIKNNTDSFDYIYTENKAQQGGKGFGRFVYLKYFKQAKISSIFMDGLNKKQHTFDFVKEDKFTTNKKTINVSEDRKIGTEILLDTIYKEHIFKLDKKLETISRKLLENLLVFFTLDSYKCPKITVIDEHTNESIELNSLINNKDGISEILNKEVELVSKEKSEKQLFKAKVFKVYYGESRSSINLVANQRQVTDTALYEYIPEFKDDFFDKTSDDKGEIISKNYTVKVYLSGKYLDSNISETRESFLFPKHEKDLYSSFCQRDIESLAASVAKEAVHEEVKLRQEKKRSRVQDYINSEAPYHRLYANKLDYSTLPYDSTNEQIESELQKTRFRIESDTRKNARSILDNKKFEINKKFSEMVDSLTDLGESDLSHYIVLRKLVLELFKKTLAWDGDEKYDKEKVVHDIIFPTRCDSDTIPYDQHNLWIVDEKLCFHEYLASDKPLNKNDQRPDILIFDKKIPLRSGDELSNPIVVVEFKKPQRTNYSEQDNPLKQIAMYVEKIRKKEFKTPQGRTLNINENTPAFGYLICDLTPKIHDFCKDYDLTLSPDNQGYFGFHNNHKIYFEVISFDKLVKDAEQRNKVFFNKLKID